MPNEYIGNRLAMALRLPVGEGALAMVGDRTFFTSHSPALESPFGLDDLALLVGGREREHARHMATGCAAFDCWVVNQDRHAKNVLFDPLGTGGIQFLDHGEALFVGRTSADATLRLQKVAGEAAWTGGVVLGPLLANEARTTPWVERICSVSEAFIDAVCVEAVGSGHGDAFTLEDAEYCARFLKERRMQLLDILGFGSGLGDQEAT